MAGGFGFQANAFMNAYMKAQEANDAHQIRQAQLARLQQAQELSQRLARAHQHLEYDPSTGNTPLQTGLRGGGAAGNPSAGAASSPPPMPPSPPSQAAMGAQTTFPWGGYGTGGGNYGETLGQSITPQEGQNFGLNPTQTNYMQGYNSIGDPKSGPLPPTAQAFGRGGEMDPSRPQGFQPGQLPQASMGGGPLGPLIQYLMMLRSRPSQGQPQQGGPGQIDGQYGVSPYGPFGQ